MEDPIFSEVRNGLKIEIHQDECHESPEEWGDDQRFLVGYHRDFTVGEKDVSQELARSIANGGKNEDGEVVTAAMDYVKKYHIFGLEAYIHSGVSLALSNEGNFPDRNWDVSQLGLVFIAKTECKTRAQAKKAALSLISTWNDYLSGNVYGYIIKDSEDNDIDSCWGFYGDYEKAGGALSEARSIVDHRTNKGKTDQHGQLLFTDLLTAAVGTKKEA